MKISLILIVLLGSLPGLSAWTATLPVEVPMQGVEWEEGVLFSCLQGLMNREGPNVFLNWHQYCEQWLEWDKTRFGANPERLADRWELLELARPYVKGYVLWDPLWPEEGNLASNYAAQQDLIPVPKPLEARVAAYGYQKVADITEQFAGWGFPRIYDWTLDNLTDWNKSVVACLTTPIELRLDVSKYVRPDGLTIKFSDVRPEDGMGAKFELMTLLDEANKPLVQVAAGAPDEGDYLIDEYRSWFDPEGDRIADQDQYFIYRLPATPGSSYSLRVRVKNGYKVEALDAAGNWQLLRQVQFIQENGKWVLPYSPYPENLTRDYVVAHKGLFFNLSADPDNYPEEYAVRNRLLDSMDKPGWVLGWQTERDSEALHVQQASTTGNFVICSGAPNFSWHQWMKPESLPKPQVAPPPPLEKGKVYVSFILSDGDATWCLYSFQSGHWPDAGRGQAPFGWEVQPLAHKLAPDIFTYYVEQATDQDALIGAFGAGYNYPNLMAQDDLERYLNFVGETLDTTGYQYASVLCQGPATRDFALTWEAAVGDRLTGMQEGYAGIVGDDFPLPGLIWLKTRLPKGPSTKEQLLEQLRHLAAVLPERPLFVPIHLPLGPFRSPDDALWIQQQLDPNQFKLVRPDQLFALAREYYDANPVVEYPRQAIALEGLPLSIEARLSNASQSEQTYTLMVEEAPLVKVNMTLSPRAQGTAKLAFPAKEGELNLKVSWPGGELRRKLAARVIPSLALPEQPKSAQLVSLYSAALDFAHRSGALGEAEDAWQDRVWVSGQSEELWGNYTLFGPYLPVPAGEYLALFRLKPNGALPEGNLGEVDVFEHGEVLGKQQLRGSDLLQEGWSYVAVPFTNERDRDQVEYRLLLTTPEAQLILDSVAVFRVTY